MENALQAGTGALSELRRSYELNTYLWNHSIATSLIPAVHSMVGLQHDMADLMVSGMTGRRAARACLRDLGNKVRSGAVYNRRVRKLGGKLFGTARFEGETKLAENDYLRLSYLPPLGGVEHAGVSLFHVGGFLPFSDAIFRILPEANLFLSFLRRGVPVYAMELKGDRKKLGDLRGVNLERFIDMIDQLSDLAFAHSANKKRKMIAEGYCGLGLPTLAYIAAKPERADAKFKVAATMVAPIDARHCALLSKPLGLASEPLLGIHGRFSELVRGHVTGNDLRVGLDLPLGASLHKSPFGRFVSGWGNPVYAHLSSVEELDPFQRREMAGAYWISPENARRFPMPVELVRLFVRLFREGVTEDLRIPASYYGKQINLGRIAESTAIRIVGFYGGKDRVVPDSTAWALKEGLGDRYTHVVHEKAGHISYVLSPEQWDSRHPAAFSPNPLELMMSLYSS